MKIDEIIKEMSIGRAEKKARTKSWVLYHLDTREKSRNEQRQMRKNSSKIKGQPRSCSVMEV